jgi:hypothetical protein
MLPKDLDPCDDEPRRTEDDADATREPEPPRHWIMPSIGKTYSDERDPASEADVSEPDEAAPDAEGIGR